MNNIVDPIQKVLLVQKQSCFSLLTPAELEQLTGLFVEQHIPAGTTIVTEGDPVDSVYIIIQGSADVRHVTIQDGAMHIQSLATLDAGKAIGLNERGFYSLSGIRTATVVALTDMVVLRLSMPAFNGFSLAYPHVNEIMHRNSPIISDEK